MISFTLEVVLFGRMGHGMRESGQMIYNKGKAAITY